MILSNTKSMVLAFMLFVIYCMHILKFLAILYLPLEMVYSHLIKFLKYTVEYIYFTNMLINRRIKYILTEILKI